MNHWQPLGLADPPSRPAWRTTQAFAPPRNPPFRGFRQPPRLRPNWPGIERLTANLVLIAAGWWLAWVLMTLIGRML